MTTQRNGPVGGPGTVQHPVPGARTSAPGPVDTALGDARVPVRRLAADAGRAARALSELRLPPPAGMLADVLRSSGGVLVDDGWVRLLGTGADGLPGVLEATRRESEVERWPEGAGAVVVAYDVLGGRFAVNRGSLPGEVGELAYWGPDTLEWATLGASYETFPAWLVSGALDTFYADLRWDGWRAEVAAVAPGDGLVCYPFLFSDEGRDISLSVRVPTPFGELLDLHDDLARQVGYLPSAPTIRIRR